jgi:hypothetical protein
MTIPHLNILAFGSCRVQNCIYDLERRGLAKSIMGAFGFAGTPYSVTTTDALQQVEYVQGRIQIPMPLRRYVFFGHQLVPGPAQARTLEETEAVLFEINHPFSLTCGNYVLTRRTFEVIFDPIAPKELRWWFDALFRNDPQRQEETARNFANAVLEAPDETMPAEERRETAEIIRAVKVRQLSMAEVADGIVALRAATGRPVGVSPFAAAFMPPNRFVYWPGNFRSELAQACRITDTPVFDLEGTISNYRRGLVFRPDKQNAFGYYTDEFQTVLGEAYHAFLRDLTGSLRPSIAGPAYGRERVWMRGEPGYSVRVLNLPPHEPGAPGPANGTRPDHRTRQSPWSATRATFETVEVGTPFTHPARRIEEDASGTTHDIRSVLYLERDGDAVSVSFFARPQERTAIAVWLWTLSERGECVFDLAGARVRKVAASDDTRPLTYGAIPVAGGWVWCHVTFAAKPRREFAIFVGLADEKGSAFYKGDGRSGCLIAGQRIEIGQRATLDLGAPRGEPTHRAAESLGRPATPDYVGDTRAPSSAKTPA